MMMMMRTKLAKYNASSLTSVNVHCQLSRFSCRSQVDAIERRRIRKTIIADCFLLITQNISNVQVKSRH